MNNERGNMINLLESQNINKNLIKDVENFLKENHVIFNNTSREEFSKECEKFIKNKKVCE